MQPQVHDRAQLTDKRAIKNGDRLCARRGQDSCLSCDEEDDDATHRTVIALAGEWCWRETGPVRGACGARRLFPR